MAGNLTTSGTAISNASLTAGAAMMQRQTGLSAGADPGVKLNLQPKFLLAAPEKRAEAFQFTSTSYVPAAPTSINAFGGVLTPLLDANLLGNRWYLFASPDVAPAITYRSLDASPRLAL